MQEYEHEYARFIYYTPGELDREAQLWPIRGGRTIAKPNYRVGPKRIECYSLHFVLGGELAFEYDDRRIELRRGDVFCLFPEQTYHYYIVPSDSDLRMSWLALDGSRTAPLLELAGVTEEQPYARERITPRVTGAAERILGAMAGVERWSPAASLELQGLIWELLAGLMPEMSSVRVPQPSGWIRECMQFMDLHATEGITVRQVAEFAGMHRSYFSNAFASQVGIPPQKYIQNIRMKKARRLLLETDATVTEIALSLGYPNLYTFTRAFKSYYRAAPLHVRTAGG
ncbi:AraC family transcriptional regulator [Saccharibacillus sp. CPCC 101409]|nr:AraC family transcriptional regulator [Saccharibacillus sp. CPCC 101409]MDO3408925.1 AraC family transcriptional regulator [Saccharibacillus sp. CPCC 101409]